MLDTTNFKAPIGLNYKHYLIKNGNNAKAIEEIDSIKIELNKLKNNFITYQKNDRLVRFVSNEAPPLSVVCNYAGLFVILSVSEESNF